MMNICSCIVDPSMSRGVVVAFAVCMSMSLVLLVAAAARAEPTVAELSEMLKSNPDWRIRTQAAVALGPRGDEAAVAPLCEALGDANNAVKAASAAALGKLGKPGGLVCLKTALASEREAGVRAQIEKSIADLVGGARASGVPPPPTAGTKFYVALEISNKTARPLADIEAIVRTAMQSRLLSKAEYAVAPPVETAFQAASMIARRKLKGFFLIATVEPPIYEAGKLIQAVRVSMWTYPGKALKGEIPVKLTQTETPTEDRLSENTLMRMCVENAIDSFQSVALSL